MTNLNMFLEVLYRKTKLVDTVIKRLDIFTF